MRRSQTSTEYLILIAVIIVIGLYSASQLYDFAGMGPSTKTNSLKSQLSTMELGVLKFAVSNSSSLLNIRNNYKLPVIVTSIEINQTICSLNETRLKSGEVQNFICLEVVGTVGDNYNFPLTINWTEESSGSAYTQYDSEARLLGVVTSSVLS